MKPFNFVLSAQVAPFGHPEGADPSRFHLIAPFEPDPRRWKDMEWTDLYSGRPYQITVRNDWYNRPNEVRVKTYREVVNAYRVHPEAKSLGSDGKPCGRGTVGLLSRRPVADLTLSSIGKESNRLEDVEAGLVHGSTEVLNSYDDPRRGPWERLVRPVLQDIPARWLVERTALSRRTIQRLRNGHSRPRSSHKRQLTLVAAAYARKVLASLGKEAPHEDFGALTMYLDIRS